MIAWRVASSLRKHGDSSGSTLRGSTQLQQTVCSRYSESIAANLHCISDCSKHTVTFSFVHVFALVISSTRLADIETSVLSLYIAAISASVT